MILNTQGYVVDRRIPKVQNGLHIEITTFQGEHRDEYCVKEVSSGRFSLFRKGVLQMNGKFVAGTSTGDFTTYTMGKAKYRYFENSSRREDGVRYVENCKNGLQLVVEGNDVIYRGGFDSVKSMKREGKGVEYDEKSGRVLRCGVWKHDELFQVIQEFESEDMMIEYEVKEGEENVSVLNRHPVYEGGYVFEEGTCTYLRDGDGCEIEGGIASREGKWERGTLIESVNLFDGWYVKMDENDVLDWRWPNEGMDPLSNLARQNEERVAELVIPSACCNECSLKQLDVSGWKELKRIEIGDDCFGNVDEVKLIGLSKLESVVIGKRSFTKHKNGFGNNPSRHFCLKDCERLKELKIGNYSFSDYTLCRIEEVDSLETIAIGDWTDKSWSFYWADLELKHLPRLKSIQLGGHAFDSCERAVLENLSELTFVQLGTDSLRFDYANEDTTLILHNLPKLCSILTVDEKSKSFRFPRHIALSDLQCLSTVVLSKEFAFSFKSDVKKKGALSRLS